MKKKRNIFLIHTLEFLEKVARFRLNQTFIPNDHGLWSFCKLTEK